MKLLNKDKSANFKKYKGSLERLYSNEGTLVRLAGGRQQYYDILKTKNRDAMVATLRDNLSDPTKAADVSETLVASNGIYAEIIEYYTNLPLYRYTVIPAKAKEPSGKKDSAERYKKVYNEMISVVDGISIEVTYPKILQTGLIYGIIYLYTEKNKSTNTIETFMLPHKYCRKGFSTNYGTDTVVFDLKFFDDIKMRLSSSSGLKIEDEEFYDLFPKELVDKYNDYKNDPQNLRWQELEPKFSTAISFSQNSMPPKLYANFGLIDYDIIKANEVTRSQNELEKILVHEIPHNSDGELMFDFEEAVEIHESMARALSGVKGLKLLTTFGKTDLKELQSEKTKENKTIMQSYDGIFYGAGMNPEIFRGDNNDSLKVALQKDKAYIFKMLDLIVNFYNLAINNLYNFSPYQAKISLLPISVYDETEKITRYLENATFGIGKLEAVVAAGVKQKDIKDKHTLEEYLELDEILVPLKSSHTTTTDVSSPEEPKKETQDEPKEDVESPAEEEVPEEEQELDEGIE